MAFNNKLKNGQLASGTTVLTSVAAGTITAGASYLQMQNVVPGTLSALVTVDAETDTITLSAVWQVSNDASTWYRCNNSNSAATVVLMTGTAGADTAVTRVIDANPAVYGWRYARIGILNLEANGLIADTFATSYSYLARDLV
jgi:hypothetical protein